MRLSNSIVRIAGPILVIAALQGFLLYGASNWWHADDPAIITDVEPATYAEILFSSDAYRKLSASNFTPLVFILYKMDWDLFGLNPGAFHVHNVVVTTLVLFLLYLVVRIFFGATGGLVVVFCFALSRPFLEAQEVLMTRHYTTGLALALCATLCFLHSLTSHSRALSWLGGLLFLAASLSKEIFVPLPVLLLVLPVANIRSRFNALVPMLLLIPVYASWRFLMLGGIGGYGLALSGRSLTTLPVTVFEIMGWDQWAARLCLIGLLGIYWIVARPIGRVFLAVFACTALLPVMPVAEIHDVRYALIPSLGIAVLLGYSTVKSFAQPSWSSRAFAVLLVGLFIMGPWWRNIMVWRPAMRQSLEKSRVEGQFILKGGTSADFVYQPYVHAPFFAGLGRLRTSVLSLPPGPRPLYDYSILTTLTTYRLFQYDTEDRKLRELRSLPKEVEHGLENVDLNRQLFLKILYEDPVIRWEFGPWRDGAYAILTGDYYQNVLELPPTGTFPIRMRDDLDIQLRYESPAGWRTYSPRLRLSPNGGMNALTWSRGYPD